MNGMYPALINLGLVVLVAGTVVMAATVEADRIRSTARAYACIPQNICETLPQTQALAATAQPAVTMARIP